MSIATDATGPAAAIDIVSFEDCFSSLDDFQFSLYMHH